MADPQAARDTVGTRSLAPGGTRGALDGESRESPPAVRGRMGRHLAAYETTRSDRAPASDDAPRGAGAWAARGGVGCRLGVARLDRRRNPRQPPGGGLDPFPA